MALLAVVLAAHMAEKTLFLMVKLDLQTQVAVAVVAWAMERLAAQLEALVALA